MTRGSQLSCLGTDLAGVPGLLTLHTQIQREMRQHPPDFEVLSNLVEKTSKLPSIAREFVENQFSNFLGGLAKSKDWPSLLNMSEDSRWPPAARELAGQLIDRNLIDVMVCTLSGEHCSRFQNFWNSKIEGNSELISRLIQRRENTAVKNIFEVVQPNVRNAEAILNRWFQSVQKTILADSLLVYTDFLFPSPALPNALNTTLLAQLLRHRGVSNQQIPFELIENCCSLEEVERRLGWLQKSGVNLGLASYRRTEWQNAGHNRKVARWLDQIDRQASLTAVADDDFERAPQTSSLTTKARTPIFQLGNRTGRLVIDRTNHLVIGNRWANLGVRVLSVLSMVLATALIVWIFMTSEARSPQVDIWGRAKWTLFQSPTVPRIVAAVSLVAGLVAFLAETLWLSKATNVKVLGKLLVWRLLLVVMLVTAIGLTIYHLVPFLHFLTAKVFELFPGRG